MLERFAAEGVHRIEDAYALAALDADTLLTGHGPAWRGPASKAVARAREAGVA